MALGTLRHLFRGNAIQSIDTEDDRPPSDVKPREVPMRRAKTAGRQRGAIGLK